MRRKILCLFLLLFLVFAVYKVYSIIYVPKTTPSPNTTVASHTDWKLILINDQNLVPTDYNIELTKLSNGESVDSRIFPALQKMFDDARAVGIYPIVRSGYRTHKEQAQLLSEKIEEHMAGGKSKKLAEELAKEWVALPGSSEHQLGIAIDINADPAHCTNDDVYDWLAEHAHKYGFILRYPQDKIQITGIMYEPWHYRYVGETAAKEIHHRGICLEEYL